MIRLRLSSLAQPGRQIEQRMIGEDAVTIGRDAGADWVIADPERGLSRRHCTVRLFGSNLGLRDTSANGTFVGDEAERIAPGTETIVAPGGRIRLGTFALSVEALASEQPAPLPSPQTGPATRSLFAPPSGLDPVSAPSRPARPDPFASQLDPDPLLAEHKPGDRVVLGEGDAWDRRPAARAGDWDVPRDRGNHEDLIGTPREWAEPPRAERDTSFGFDAPFERPILAAPPATQADVDIPVDWAEPVAAEKAVVAPLTVEVPRPSPAPPPPPVISPSKSATSIPVAPRPADPPTQAIPLTPPTPPVAHGSSDAALFDAFCAGARLSPASFAADDRAAVMTRLGEVYRGMVLGLADLMSERTALKNEYRLSRTMVRAEQNNPFKWAPPQRLAIEVLRGGDAGFAGGGEAVADSFRDIKIHLLCMLAGMRAAITATMGALAPAAAEAAVEGRFLIKTQRDAALWLEYLDRFERFKTDADDSVDGPVNRAFRAAYEKQYGELENAGSGYAGGAPERMR